MKSKFFETNRINEYITQIIGLAGEQCYLIEGNDRALLFDGLCGEGSDRRQHKRIQVRVVHADV